MSDIYLVPKDELYHYGIKGMKWGVRKTNQAVQAVKKAHRAVSDDIKGVVKYGVRRQVARNTSRRIENIKKSERMDYMSARQKQSLSKADAYWKAKAEGRKTAKGRGLIKRIQDVQRSHTYETRYAKELVSSMLSQRNKKVVDLDTGTVEKGKISAMNALKDSGFNMLYDELVNRAFGHF